MPFLIIGAIILFGLIVLPQIWVRRVLAQHSAERSDFPGTGGELARHLLDGMGLQAVKVEETDQGDHYDPEGKAVRLSADNYNGKSLTAVVIATHEVGHAMQDATGYAPLQTRTKLAKLGGIIETAGVIVMFAAPVMAALVKHPIGLGLQLAAGLSLLAFTVLIHLATLRVEFDASFKRALPVLQAGKYIPDEDMPAARRILQAAAMTYVAAALLSLINIMRWLRVIRI